jgi:hypothetical protein
MTPRRSVMPLFAKRVWTRVKRTLEYAHLLEFLLHAGHSDVLALVLFTLRWPAGWLVLGWVFAAYFYIESRRQMPKSRAIRGKKRRRGR